jgi:hypothetical protein
MTATPETPETTEEKDAREHASSLQEATEVLKIYSDGLPDPWKRVREKYPKFADKGRASAGMPYRKFNAETMLVWAAGVVAGDPVNLAGPAFFCAKIPGKSGTLILDNIGRDDVHVVVFEVTVKPDVGKCSFDMATHIQRQHPFADRTDR